MSDMKIVTVFRHELKISRAMLDENRHVNNIVYVQWMQDIAVMHSAANGGTRLMHSLNSIWFVRSHRIEYLAPAYLNEEVTALTWVSNIKRATSLRRYCFIRKSDSKILVRCETEWVLIDAGTGRPRRIPEEMACLYPVVPEDEEPCSKIIK